MQDLIKEFNRKRRTNKDRWIQFTGTIHGQPVAIKSYNTWIQIATYGDRRGSGPMNCTVTAMNDWLTSFLVSK